MSRNRAADSDKTLAAWFKNFHGNWDRMQLRYGPRFCRMWKYYLLASASALRCRKAQL